MAPSIYGAASWFRRGRPRGRSLSLQADSDKVASFLDSSHSVSSIPSPRSQRGNPHSFIATPISSARPLLSFAQHSICCVPSAFFIHGHSCRSSNSYAIIARIEYTKYRVDFATISFFFLFFLLFF